METNNNEISSMSSKFTEKQEVIVAVMLLGWVGLKDHPYTLSELDQNHWPAKVMSKSPGPPKINKACLDFSITAVLILLCDTLPPCRLSAMLHPTAHQTLWCEGVFRPNLKWILEAARLQEKGQRKEASGRRQICQGVRRWVRKCFNCGGKSVPKLFRSTSWE